MGGAQGRVSVHAFVISVTLVYYYLSRRFSTIVSRNLLIVPLPTLMSDVTRRSDPAPFHDSAKRTDCSSQVMFGGALSGRQKTDHMPPPDIPPQVPMVSPAPSVQLCFSVLRLISTDLSSWPASRSRRMIGWYISAACKAKTLPRAGSW